MTASKHNLPPVRPDSIYDFQAYRLNGQLCDLARYRGKLLLIVNTASRCGFTPQYQQLEQLYQRYRGQGLEILGFPCNQFGQQESGSDTEIASFCEVNYGVSFPMFAKVKVNGDDSHPLFDFLKQQAPGLLGSRSIKWNFTKFLVAADGRSVKRYAPRTSPLDLEAEIRARLPGNSHVPDSPG